MVERTDPADRLLAIGRNDAPPLDTDRLAAIEARVLGAIADGTLTHDGGRRRPVTLVLAAAAVLVLAVLGLVALAAGRDSDGGVLLEAADAVIIVTPGHDAKPAGAGDELDDGAVIDVRPGGSATVAGVVFGPGRYRVDGDELRPVAAVDDRATTTSVPSTIAVRPSTSVVRTTSTTSTTTSTTRSTTRSTTTAPTPTRPAAPAAATTTTVTPRAVSPSTRPPTPTTTLPRTAPAPTTTAPSTGAPPPTTAPPRPRPTTTTVAPDRGRGAPPTTERQG